MNGEQSGLPSVQGEPGALEQASTRPAAAGLPPSVELHIEELVLHGFAPGERHRIGEAVERALMSLLIEQGVPPSLINGGEVAHLDAGRFHLALDSGADAVGRRIAEAVYGGLNR